MYSHFYFKYQPDLTQDGNKKPQVGRENNLRREFARPWKFCASHAHSIETVYLNFWTYTGTTGHVAWLIQAHVTNIFPP